MRALAALIFAWGAVLLMPANWKYTVTPTCEIAEREWFGAVSVAFPRRVLRANQAAQNACWTRRGFYPNDPASIIILNRFPTSEELALWHK